MKRKLTLLIALSLFAAVPALPQGPPFAAGLQMPTRLTLTQNGNVLVAEGGTPTANSGRLSVIERTTRVRRTLIDGLPSGLSQSAEGSSPSGPSGVVVSGMTVYVVIGAGDAVIPGPAPGSELANPSPSSPLLASLLAVRTDRSLDVSSGGFTLQPSDHARLAAGESVVLLNTAGESATVRMVANFPDYTAEPRGDVPANVRAGNPFGVALRGNTAYVVDASQNLVRAVDTISGEVTTLATFGKVQNPLPFGPPVVDPVPDAIRVRGDDLLVGLLVGFPFPPGKAEIKRVDAGGSIETEAAGLTSVIDLEVLGNAPKDPLLVLEFSTSMTEGAPGRLLMVESDGSTSVIAEGLPTPSGVAVDRQSGEIFVSHIFPGLITRIDASAILPRIPPSAVIPAVASLPGAHGAVFSTSMQLANPHPFPIAGSLVVRPRGAAGGHGDPSLAYALDPFETIEIADFMTAAGAAGAGSVDILASVGTAPITVTLIADHNAEGMPAVSVPQVDPADSLTLGSRGMLITPPEERWRMNVGIRTLDDSSITLRMMDAAGAEVAAVTHVFPATWYQQTTVEELLGVAPPHGGSIVIEMNAGIAIVYGVRIENASSDATMQVARRIFD